MKSLLWFLIGIVGGFAAAHVINNNPTGRELLAEVDARIGEFTDRIGEAYRGQEAKFEDFVSETKDAMAEAKGALSRAVDSATDSVSDVASDAGAVVADATSDAASAARD